MKKIIFSLFLSIYSINCFAENNSQKFYFGAEFGYTRPQDNTDEIEKRLLYEFGGSANVSQKSYITDFRAFGGLNISNYLDLELGLSATDNFETLISGKTKEGLLYNAKFTSYYTGLDFSALIRPFSGENLKNLYFRAGGTYLKTDENYIASSSSSKLKYYYNQNFQTSGNGYILGFGYDLPLSSKLKHIRFSWNHLGNISGISGNYSNQIAIGYFEKF